jgi:hypothetical protein
MSGSGEPSLALGQTRSPTILAVILGAQKWPNMSSLRASNSFALSAKAFKDYLKDETGLNLPQSCIKDLFDSELGRDATDLEIRNFLEEHYVEESLILLM